MKDGFLRVAAVTPNIRVADPAHNVSEILRQLRELPQNTAVAVFPELSITGCTCGDLFLQPTLLQGAENALAYLLAGTADMRTVITVGLPVQVNGSLYNCAALLYKGELLGLVPKTYLKKDSRYFAAGDTSPLLVTVAGQQTTLAAEQIFTCADLPSFRLGVELSDDLYAPQSVSTALALQGATVIANLCACPETAGAAVYRETLVQVQSAKLNAAYICANAGNGESTTDTVFAGGNHIAENGTILQQSAPFTTGAIYTEIDVNRLVSERMKNGFSVSAPLSETVFSLSVQDLQLTRTFEKFPFVPQNAVQKDRRAEEILSIQAAGLQKRLAHTNLKAVVGLSGGLDSALALLVITRAYDALGWDRKDIHTVTMPCFGTTGRTFNNAKILAETLGTTLHTIPIREAVLQHFSDIGHDGVTTDVTYENAQARERTQVLMDLANQVNGLVVGTGDLSELALGWATFNGDHMSMYGVNGGVPKTLVRHLVDFEAKRIGGDAGAVLRDILDTPVSPELLPPKDGEIAQQTEQLVGPYVLHDFILYYAIRYGYTPAKIYRIACHAFYDAFTTAEIKKWLLNFYKRFFGAQFKRSCLPDGPKVGSVSFSPRSDWQMPSDAVAALWMKEAENV